MSIFLFKRRMKPYGAGVICNPNQQEVRIRGIRCNRLTRSACARKFAPVGASAPFKLKRAAITTATFLTGPLTDQGSK
jgi:hypothetical protein